MRSRHVMRFFGLWVVGVLLLCFSLSYSQQKQKRLTIFYTHAIDGCLEPCG